MIKKIIHIVFALLLILVTVGMTFSKHYCQGELVETAINSETYSCCDGAEDDSCCQHEVLRVELENDFVKMAEVVMSPTHALEILYPLLLAFQFDLFESEKEKEQHFPDPGSLYEQTTRLALNQAYLC